MNDALAVLLGVVAVGAAGFFAVRFALRARPVAPLSPGTRPQPVREGPVATLVANARDAQGLRLRIEPSARAALLEWLDARGVKPEQATEAARSGRVKLAPALVHLLEGGTPDAWARAERRARWRGPAFLFPLWNALAGALQSDDARAARWLDVMTQELVKTVQSP